MEPRLLTSFRLAMATLYSLPLPPGVSVSETPQQANNFLIELQSRNTRRRVLSLQQRQRDQSLGKGDRRNPGLGDDDTTMTMVHMGSSWLAFLAVLVQMQQHQHEGTICFVSSPTERLFAAQSVLHRVRRNKLVDAIDLEIEQDDIDEAKALQMYHESNATTFVGTLVEAYVTILGAWNPFVRDVVAASLPTTSNGESSADTVERVKGELMIVTLAAVAYITACQPAETPQRGQILEALGSAIAVIALRIRYLNPALLLAETSSATPATANEPQSGLVWVVAHSFQRVYERAVSFHSDPLALGAALAATLGSLPDTILGSPGGARGRLSVDPRSLEAAVTNLRFRGFHDLWSALQHISTSLTTAHSPPEHHGYTILCTLEKWARFLCVPPALVNDVSSLLVSSLGSREHRDRAIALRFVVAVVEGGTWSVEKVLSFGLGLSEHQLTHQSGKKKQSSRSRKRHKELVNNRSNEVGVDQARSEVVERGQVACLVVTAAWSGLRALLDTALLGVSQSPQHEVDGEGPIAAVATVAQCILPLLMEHIKKSPTHLNVFRELSDSLIQLATSKFQAVRCLVVPPVYALFKAHVGRDRGDQDAVVLDVLLQCLFGLASNCSYPPNYFDDLCTESDEELEVHRNDVRDLARALTGGDDVETEESISTESKHLLCRVVLLLKEEIAQQQGCPKETLIHAVSAFAKPLGRLAKEWRKLNDDVSLQCLSNALEVVLTCLNQTISLFHEAPQETRSLLPPARTLNIAIASLAPMLGALATSDATRNGVAAILPNATRLSKLSLRFLPELATSMNLNYEIRGTMRGPSGEDHVGVLNLMRLTSECTELTSMMVHTMAPEMNEFCELHEYLKSIEVWGERPEPKTLPKSRRILLGILCDLELFSNGQSGASAMLERLVHSAVALVNSVDTTRLTEQSFFLLCETTFDLASLSPLLPSSFFDHEGEKRVCVETLLAASTQAYTAINASEENRGAIHQWHRLRGALFTFLLASANPDCGETISCVRRDLIRSECHAVKMFFSGAGNPLTISSEDDEVPSGIFIMSSGEAFEKNNKTVPLFHCFQSLLQAAAAVIETILLPDSCPSGDSTCDPRCCIAEAWFRSMTNVSKSPVLHQYSHIEEVLTNTFIAGVTLILMPKFGSDGEACMSTDGPQSLALMDFLCSFLSLGPQFLGSAMTAVSERFPVLATTNVESVSSGLAIFVASLFRAIQGTLPPWVVESVPVLLSNLHVAVGNNSTVLVDAFRVAVDLRVPANAAPVCGIRPGQLLSGYAFDGLSQSAKDSFLKEAGELVLANNWKRLKHCLKAACGGKKKDTSFHQKPSSTRWEFDRI